MIFALALKLGYASPAKMLAEMRPSELGTYMALSFEDPWDEQRADLRAGIVASTIANVHRKRGTPPIKASDFLPRYGMEAQTAVEHEKRGDWVSRMYSFLRGHKGKPRGAAK